LKDFIKEIKALGYKVKLDTNGTKPWVVKELIDEKLIDYVAMDLKASPKKYNEVTRTKVNLELIKTTIKILKTSGIKHEFRTTYLPTLDNHDIDEITENFVGKDSKYFLQQFRNTITNDPEYHNFTPHKDAYVLNTAATVKAHIGMCGVRGLAH
jgi:pyruvate formate lyase activating enzyme